MELSTSRKNSGAIPRARGSSSVISSATPTPKLYQGHSYTSVYIEEAGNFPSPVPVLKLFATLRSGANVPVGMRLTGNPGGPGHQWVRRATSTRRRSATR